MTEDSDKKMDEAFDQLRQDPFEYFRKVNEASLTQVRRDMERQARYGRIARKSNHEATAN